ESPSATTEVQDDIRSVAVLPRLIDELDVQDVLIVLGRDDQRNLSDVLRRCDGKSVVLKLIPDFYHMLGGMARTEQIYGLPMIEVMPEPMRPWESSAKRLLDIVVSTLVLLVGAPMWLSVAALIRITSHGNAIFRQERVGQYGRLFTMYKFRTMHDDAESDTGPVWATEDDPRYTRLGRWLRRTRIDEVPQLINVLKGDMSLVGPRPEREYFVEKLVKDVPLYRRRLRVKPGITGIAQVKWKYDQSLEDVRQKVKYDLFYISNMSLRMDLKILFATVRTMLSGKGH
ncbi:MAG TPA: sugar transferase, partial [Rhodothermia bacterium]